MFGHSKGKTCGTCAFYSPSLREGHDNGQCRFNPPDSQKNPSYPMCKSDNWCGKWWDRDHEWENMVGIE